MWAVGEEGVIKRGMEMLRGTRRRRRRRMPRVKGEKGVEERRVC